MQQPIFGHFSPPLKLMLFVFILLVSLLFTTLISILVAVPFYGSDILDSLSMMKDYSDPATINLWRYLQISNQLGLFLIPPLFFAWLVSSHLTGYLRLNVKPKAITLLLGILVFLTALPFNSWLGELNQMMKLPAFMSGIENWMRRAEDQNMELMLAFLSTKTIAGFSINLIMIAVIPGIGEELVFRGVLIKLFKNWTGNVHVAVIISSLLFSAIHMQFYGFVPRLVLGLILGYLFVWSGSIWVPIILHFFNNAFALVVLSLSNNNLMGTDMEAIGKSSNPIIIVVSFLLFVFLMGSIYYFQKAKIQEE
jgi:CAAX protease family protein